MRTLARILMASILGAACVGFAGCSGLQTRGIMTPFVITNANIATVELGTLPVPKAQADDSIHRNAVWFTLYRQNATMNVLAYWFGGKMIFTNAALYQDVNQFAALHDDYIAKTTTRPALYTEAQVNHILSVSDTAAVNIEKAREGVKP
jgi:hypothetical protein